jgi:hypothetical protein
MARYPVTLNLEQLSDRIVPTTAVFSNGTLTVLGDNQGNNILVSADSTGALHVTERGQAVAISGSTPATLSNVTQVVEKAGTGQNNTLATAPSLGGISDVLVGNGGGVVTLAPGNNAPSTATGSPVDTAINHFLSNPGGKDVFTGGKGDNLFDWEPGTGTDTYIGAGKLNEVLVVGNSGGQSETDTLTPDGNGGVVYSRTNLVPFNLYTTGIQNWEIEPSTGSGNIVTVGDMTGTATKKVSVDLSGGTVNASGQNNASVALVVNGSRDTVSEGAGTTRLTDTAAPTADTIIAAWLAKQKQSS